MAVDKRTITSTGPPAATTSNSLWHFGRQFVVCPAIGALGLSSRFYRQIDLRMRVPQIHSGQRTVQRQVLYVDAITVLRIRSDQLFLNVTCSCPHPIISAVSTVEIIPPHLPAYSANTSSHNDPTQRRSSANSDASTTRPTSLSASSCERSLSLR